MRYFTVFLGFIFAVLVINLNGATEYIGTVTPLLVTDVRVGTDAPYWGSVREVAKLGEIATPQIKNMKTDQVVKEGTLLASLDQSFFTLQLDASKAIMESNKKMLNDAIYNYKRYRKLTVPWTGATSEHTYETYISTLSSAYDSYINSVSSYLENKAFLKSTYQIASFEGIVTKVMFSQGLASQVATTVEATMINPIGVSIKIDRNKAREIGVDTPVKIIPIRGDEKPQGIFYGYSMLTPDGITFMTRNYIIKNNNINNYQVVDDLRQVVYFDSDNDKRDLAVPKSTIISNGKDEYYVYVAKGQHEMGVGKGIDSVFSINKIKIETQNLFKLRDGNTRLQALKGNSALKVGDLVINNPSKDLKDGEKVYFSNAKYTLMPGDQVKVFVGK